MKKQEMKPAAYFIFLYTVLFLTFLWACLLWLLVTLGDLLLKDSIYSVGRIKQTSTVGLLRFFALRRWCNISQCSSLLHGVVVGVRLEVWNLWLFFRWHTDTQSQDWRDTNVFQDWAQKGAQRKKQIEKYTLVSTAKLPISSSKSTNK